MALVRYRALWQFAPRISRWVVVLDIMLAFNLADIPDKFSR